MNTTMKKIYQVPETSVEIMEVEQMIASSLTSLTGDGGDVDLLDEIPDAEVLTREFIDGAFTGGDATDKAFFD